MKKKVAFILLGVLLSLTLVACGSESQEEDIKKDTQDAESEQKDTSKDEGIVREHEEDSYTLGINIEDFKKNFNENAQKYELNMEMPESEVTEYKESYLSGEPFRSEDISIYSVTHKDGALKTVVLEGYDDESRQKLFDAIEAMILSTVDGITEDEIVKIMKDLDLTDATKSGDDQEKTTVHQELKYLVDDGASGYLEFAIVHKDDPDFIDED